MWSNIEIKNTNIILIGLFLIIRIAVIGILLANVNVLILKNYFLSMAGETSKAGGTAATPVERYKYYRLAHHFLKFGIKM